MSAFDSILAMEKEKYTTQGMSARLAQPTPDPKVGSSNAQLTSVMLHSILRSKVPAKIVQVEKLVHLLINKGHALTHQDAVVVKYSSQEKKHADNALITLYLTQLERLVYWHDVDIMRRFYGQEVASLVSWERESVLTSALVGSLKTPTYHSLHKRKRVCFQSEAAQREQYVDQARCPHLIMRGLCRELCNSVKEHQSAHKLNLSCPKTWVSVWTEKM